MARDAAQSFAADMTFTDVPVSVDAGVVRCARIVKVNRAHVPCPNRAPDNVDSCFQPIRFANVVAGRERMRRVDANGERKFRTRLHNRAQMFEAMSDAFALAGGVFQQDVQPPKLQTFARKFQTASAGFYSVRL